MLPGISVTLLLVLSAYLGCLPIGIGAEYYVIIENTAQCPTHAEITNTPSTLIELQYVRFLQ